MLPQLPAPRRHTRLLGAALAGATALSVALAPVRTASAQSPVTVFTDRSQLEFFAANHGALPCRNNLDAVPDGATTFITRYANGLPCETATLSGAVVSGGAITASNPFTITFQLGAGGNNVFGADFRSSSADQAYINFYSGTTLLGTATRAIVGPSDQFLGGVSISPFVNRVEVGVTGGTTFTIDNIVTSVPEPSTYALVVTGLLGVALAAARRRRTDA